MKTNTTQVQKDVRWPLRDKLGPSVGLSGSVGSRALPVWRWTLSQLSVSIGERPPAEVEGVRDVWSPVRAAGGEEGWDDGEDQCWTGGETPVHPQSEQEAQWAPRRHRQAPGDRHPDHGWVRDGRVPSGDLERSTDTLFSHCLQLETYFLCFKLWSDKIVTLWKLFWCSLSKNQTGTMRQWPRMVSRCVSGCQRLVWYPAGNTRTAH